MRATPALVRLAKAQLKSPLLVPLHQTCLVGQWEGILVANFKTADLVEQAQHSAGIVCMPWTKPQGLNIPAVMWMVLLSSGIDVCYKCCPYPANTVLICVSCEFFLSSVLYRRLICCSLYIHWTHLSIWKSDSYMAHRNADQGIIHTLLITISIHYRVHAAHTWL